MMIERGIAALEFSQWSAIFFSTGRLIDFFSGRVVFDSVKWDGESIAEAIDDMGFDATLKIVKGITVA